MSDGDPTVVAAAGQVDSHTSTSLDEVLAGLPADKSIAVDLSRAHKRQVGGGSELIVFKPSEPVSRLLEMTGLTSQLTISP